MEHASWIKKIILFKKQTKYHFERQLKLYDGDVVWYNQQLFDTKKEANDNKKLFDEKMKKLGSKENYD